MVVERVDELAEQMGISEEELSTYLRTYGEPRVEEVLWYVWNGIAEGGVRSPPACVRSALKQNWNVKGRWKSSSPGYRPESTKMRDARKAAEKKWWQQQAEDWRPLMISLGQERVEELRTVVLARLNDENLRPVLEAADAIACNCPHAVQLARLIWEAHRRANVK